MPLEIAVKRTQIKEIVLGEDSEFSHHRVQKGRGMAFGKDETVVRRLPRIMRVVAHRMEKHRGRYLGRRHARRGVAAPGRGGGPKGVDSEPVGPVLEVFYE